MKKSIKIRVICLIVAAMVLGGAVTVAAVLGSPYETLKKAMLDALTYRNATAEANMTMKVDGVQVQAGKAYGISGDDASLSYNYDNNGEFIGFSYVTNGLNIMRSLTAYDGTEWYYASISPYYSEYGANFRAYSNGGISILSPEDRDSARMRFVELAVDVIVGDLKNNITMTSENGVRHVSGTLTENQVPELVKAALDVLVEQNGMYYYSYSDVSLNGGEYVYETVRIENGKKNVTVWKAPVRAMTDEEQEEYYNGTFYVRGGDNFWGTRYIDGREYFIEGPDEIVEQYTVPADRDDFRDGDPLRIPIKSFTINYVHGEADIGADGNLQNIEVNGTATYTDIFGDAHTMEVNVSLRFTDIGTSAPVCPIPGAEQLLTAEYAKNRFGNEYAGVYFKLNEDGSIDAGSVTTTYPGEINKFAIREELGYVNPPPYPPTIGIIDGSG